jgi:hypothetical protein
MTVFPYSYYFALFFAACFIWGTIFGLIYMIFRQKYTAMIVATLKSVVFFISFFYGYQADYTKLDDWVYLYKASRYLASDNTIMNLFFSSFSFNKAFLYKHFDSRHVLYYIQNIVVIKVFGLYYFSPVSINVILTVINGLLLRYYGGLIFNNTQKANVIFWFYIFHFEVVARSSFLNLKDICVHSFFIAACISIFYIMNIKRLLLGILCFLFSMVCMYLIRFYAVILFFLGIFSSLFAHAVIRYNFYNHIRAIIAIIASSGIVLLFILWSLYPKYLSLLWATLDSPLYGVIHFILTPIPFGPGIDLDILRPAYWLNWILLPLLFLGIIRLSYDYIQYKNIHNLFILFLFAVCVILYSVYPELRGPRHRFMLLPLQSIFVVEALFYIFNRFKVKGIGRV